MVIGGLQKFSLLDYPGSLSAIIFLQGCNFRCPFCYNPMLVVLNDTKKGHFLVKEDDLFEFLKTRVGKLEGVVVTGGEPTLHLDLPKFLKKIKKLGFKIKLDTNGTNPKMLKELLNKNLIDYIAMDIKASFYKYEKVVGVKLDLEKIKKSIKIIRECGLPYEFRTTLVPGLHTKKDIKEMGEAIKGADKWFLQKFKSDTDLVGKEFEKKKSFTDKDMREMVKIGKEYVEKCVVR